MEEKELGRPGTYKKSIKENEMGLKELGMG